MSKNGLWAKKASGLRGIVIGNGYIEFNTRWRLGATKKDFISLTHKDGRTPVVWQKQYKTSKFRPVPTGSKGYYSRRRANGISNSKFQLWERSPRSDRIAMGKNFIQIGNNFRMGDFDGKTFAITSVKQKTVVTKYSRNGKPMKGPFKTGDLSHRTIEASANLSLIHI